MKIGFSLQSEYVLPIPQVVDLLADIGFGAISAGWEAGEQLKQTICQAHRRDLTVQSLHGPLRGMPAMWSADPQIAHPLMEDLTQGVTDCANYAVPILVVHPWNGVDYTFCQEALCFDHFDRLVDHADRSGVRIAFENLEGPEYLTALMARYADCSAVGFCWDSGHERCYTPGWDFLSRFGDRLLITHLNDNFGVTDPTGRLQGTDDLHLLPYHGNTDWDQILRRLQGAPKQDILNFEFKIRPKGNRCKLDLYSQLPLVQYLQEAFSHASMIAKAYFTSGFTP